jgi:hypothetical protein
MGANFLNDSTVLAIVIHCLTRSNKLFNTYGHHILFRFRRSHRPQHVDSLWKLKPIEGFRFLWKRLQGRPFHNHPVLDVSMFDEQLYPEIVDRKAARQIRTVLEPNQFGTG